MRVVTQLDLFGRPTIVFQLNGRTVWTQKHADN